MMRDGLGESTLDVLRRRNLQVAGRVGWGDDCHLALVIEGGGMRGVVAGGMVSALEEYGLVGAFDTIHGSSAGACAGAYFLAGQAALGTRIYYEDINNNHFINVWRALSGRPVMNTAFLIDYVMRDIKPLNTNTILSQPGKLNVVATDAKTGAACVYNQFRDAAHFFSVLKGSITMPIIAGHTVRVDGVQLVDGGMVQQIALKSAIEAGATHVLVLMTRKSDELERPSSSGSASLETAIMCLKYGPKLAAVYKVRAAGINRDIDAVLNKSAFSHHPAMDYIARPLNSTCIGRLEKNANTLRLADQEARAAVRNYLDLDATRLSAPVSKTSGIY